MVYIRTLCKHIYYDIHQKHDILNNLVLLESELFKQNGQNGQNIHSINIPRFIKKNGKQINLLIVLSSYIYVKHL